MIKFPFFNAQEMNLDWILQTLKRILNFMPIYSGHVGDVLQRKVDGAAWEPISAISMDIDGLNYEPAPDAADEIPLYVIADQSNRKTTVADLVSQVTAPVTSVNGLTGAVTIGKHNVGLGNVDNVQQYSASNPPPYPVTSVNGQTGAVIVSGGGAVDSVNGQTGTVVLTKSDVGLSNVANVAQYSASNPPPYPVTSVNGMTGAVTVTASGGIGTRLWTNSSPGTDFAAQTVTLDLSPYRFVMIVFCEKSDTHVHTEIFPKSYSGYAMQLEFALYRRLTKVMSTGIEFGAAQILTDYNNSTYSTSNGALIPFHIYGIT